MSPPFSITREIGIDAGHRIQDHGSKCRNPHGHRYTVQAECHGVTLHERGEQSGMLLDFGFLKEEMMRHIDGPCDHGMILHAQDPLVKLLLADCVPARVDEAIAIAMRDGALETPQWNGLGIMKMYLVNFTPTAENLARHWYQRLQPHVEIRSKGKAALRRVVVWETPNCAAAYPA